MPAGPVRTSETARGEGRHVSTVSEAAATSAGDAAHAAPASSSGRCRRLVAVVHRQREPGPQEARGEVAAEVAEADEPEPRGSARGSGDDNDLPELGALGQAGEGGMGIGERVLRVDERPDPVCSRNEQRRCSSASVPIEEPTTDSCRQNIRARSADGSGPVVAPATTTTPPGRSDLSE